MLKGIVPPMITPFTEEGRVDLEALGRLVEFLSPHVGGLFVTGSYGSGPLMTDEERGMVTAETIRCVSPRVPVVVMVGSTCTSESVALARKAERAGASAVAAVGPYYFKYDREALVRYYGSIVDAVGIPVYVYNNPRFQGYPMEIETIEALQARGVFGVKDATFDILAHATYQRKLAPKGFDVVLGTEAMWLSAAVLGCKAFIPGLGNAFPELCNRLYQEGINGEVDACRSSQFLVNEIRDAMSLASSSQSAVYAMLELRGIIRSWPRQPVLPATDAQKEAIRGVLEAMALL